MSRLVFEPEIFATTPNRSGGCGCAACRGDESTSREWDEPSYESDDEADDPALEWEQSARPCSTPRPDEVLSCRREPARKAGYCDPALGVQCPPIPEVWTSKTIGGVPFYYDAKLERVPHSKAWRVTEVAQKHRSVNLTPAAWQSLFTFVQMMGTFGMPISAIITAGGLQCRCTKRPKGACTEKHQSGCTGTVANLSNHSFGDAFDLVGVFWKDPAAVGSSLPATVMDSWADSGDQAQLLRRINGVLRLAFATVFDYSRADHRDHFHCDTNRGNGRPTWWKRDVPSDPCEPFFIMGALKWLGYIDVVKPVTWTRARAGLTLVARKNGMPVPTGTEPRDWIEVTNRLFACVALGGPAHCKNSG